MLLIITTAHINFFNIFLLNLLIQPEIQNSINLISFDSYANFNFTIITSDTVYMSDIVIISLIRFPPQPPAEKGAYDFAYA